MGDVKQPPTDDLRGLAEFMAPELEDPPPPRCEGVGHAFSAPDDGGASVCQCGDYRVTVERIRWRVGHE